jgi:hypothetical protein
MSNFLGEVGGMTQSGSRIISAAEVIAREGVELHKSMNFRDDEFMLPVFLVLAREHGHEDVWDDENQQFVFEGHDSTTVESGRSVDQLAMYESGRLTDNGKFLKAANAFNDGIRKEPLQIQVYEKIDSGVWFDKGIFDLIDARNVSEDGRKVFKFYLTVADMSGNYSEHDPDRIERLLPAALKAEIWKRDRGRCTECLSESDLHFAGTAAVSLKCAAHSGRPKRGLL